MSKLGRRYYPDSRDKKFSMRPLLTKTPSIFRLWRFWKGGPVLDQGEYPHCVGYSWKQWLQSAPLMTMTGPTGSQIYYSAQREDEWEGEDYDGTSVRGGVKALQKHWDKVESYVWAQSPDDLKNWVLTKGPVVVGTDWHTSMFNPSKITGVVSLNGINAGGHAYIVIGYNKLTKKYRCVNSWGRGWGQNGRFWIKEDDLHKLVFDKYGEACAAVERKG